MESANHCLTASMRACSHVGPVRIWPLLSNCFDNRPRVNRLIISAPGARVPGVHFGDFGVERALELPNLVALQRFHIERRARRRSRRRRRAKVGRARVGSSGRDARRQSAPARAVGALGLAIGAPHDLRFVERLKNLRRIARAAAAAFGQGAQLVARPPRVARDTAPPKPWSAWRLCPLLVAAARASARAPVMRLPAKRARAKRRASDGEFA